MPSFGAGVGLISGGLDSTIVATYMRSEFEQQHFVFVDYGQKTLAREIKAFGNICDYLRPTSTEIIDMTWMRRIGTSALFEEDTTLDKNNRIREYVPFRNGLLLGVAIAYAENVSADAVLIGSTGTDRTCPDNSQSFLDAMQSVIELGTMDGGIKIIAPLIELDKKRVIELGLELKAPLELSWSCHNNTGDIACGGCSNCQARRQGFIDAGTLDPLKYE